MGTLITMPSQLHAIALGVPHACRSAQGVWHH